MNLCDVEFQFGGLKRDKETEIWKSPQDPGFPEELKEDTSNSAILVEINRRKKKIEVVLYQNTVDQQKWLRKELAQDIMERLNELAPQFKTSLIQRW